MAKQPPWRFWFTGGVAAVLAALAHVDAWADKQHARMSRYGARETVQRIAEGARAHGLTVFANIAPSGPRGEWLLVLGSDEAHTPVLQASADAPLELPLTVRVLDDGHSGVAVQLARREAWWDDVPPEILERLEALAALVDEALAAPDALAA